MKALLVLLTLALSSSAFASGTRLLTCNSGEEINAIHLVEVIQENPAYPSSVKLVIKKYNYSTNRYDQWVNGGVIKADAQALAIQLFRSAIPGGGGNVGINPYNGNLTGKRADAGIFAYDATLNYEPAGIRGAGVYCMKPFPKQPTATAR